MIIFIAMGNQRLRTGRIVLFSYVANESTESTRDFGRISEFSRFYTESTIVSYMVSNSVQSASRRI